MGNINLRCNLPQERHDEVFGWFHGDYLDVAEESQIAAMHRQYLFYESSWSERNIRICHCTACGGFDEFRSDSKEFFSLSSGDDGECPNCGIGVELKAMGKMRTFGSINDDDEIRISIFRPAPDGGLLVLSGWSHRKFSFNDLSPIPEFKPKEYAYFAPGVRQRWKRTWSYAGFYGHGPAYPAGWEPCEFMGEPFNPSINWTSDGSYYVICAERIADTKLKYCQVEEWYYDRCRVWLSDTAEPARFVHKFLAAYTEFPYIEMACKMGFYTAVDDLVLKGRKNAQLLDWQSPTSWGFLRLSKADGRAFIRTEGSWDLLQFYSAIRKDKAVTLKQFLDIASKVNGDSNAIKIYRTCKSIGCSVVAAVHYIDKKRGVGRIDAVVQTWCDYIRFAQDLNYDLRRTDVIFPRDLLDRHDAAAATVKVVSDAAKSRLYAKRYEVLRKMYEFTYGGYSIVVPTSAEDIVAEGRTLHHCVGGYAARHVEGKLDILFLRKERKKKTPFVTIEMSHRDSIHERCNMVQIHGFKNEHYQGGKFGSVEQRFGWFLDAWMDWLRSGSKRDAAGKPIIPEVKEVSA